MKCKNCGTELFDVDIVKMSEIIDGFSFPSRYRCPKCFTVKKVQNWFKVRRKSKEKKVFVPLKNGKYILRAKSQGLLDKFTNEEEVKND